MKYLRLLFLYTIASLLAMPHIQADVTYEVLTDWSTGPNLRGDKNKLIEGADGDFYGTSAAGGAYGHGCIFKMSPTGDVTVLGSFTGVAGDLPGSQPQGRLLLASDGDFYGTTKTGGADNFGTVFQMTPDGTMTLLAEFVGTDGRYPLAGLAEGDNEEFFGATSSGGANDTGTVFKVSTSGVIDVLFDAPGGSGKFETGLTLGSDGNFYGISKQGGANSDGAIFQIPQDGVGTNIFASFNFGAFVHTFGANSELVEDAGGNFYGTTQDGGAFDAGGKTGGTIYKVTSGGVISTLVSFTGTTGANKGAWPTGGLILGADEFLYGTTVYGGSGAGDGLGTVFKVTTTGTLTTLAQLSATSSSLPDGGVIEGSDGNFYGIGANSLYSLSSAAVFTELADTDRKLGQNPKAGLIEDAPGEFYGTTSAGGYVGDFGTIFKITSAQVYTELTQFDGNPLSGGVEGAYPFAGLINGADGNFYGATTEGGANNFGTVFKVTPSGVLSTLAEFTGNTGAKKGSYPHGALCQDTNGDLYGTTMEGGADGLGTIFKITSGGVFSTVLEFDGFNGSYPDAGLIKGSGGFFGTTRTGGASDLGTAFMVTSGGVLTALHEFSGTDGSNPSSSLVEVSPGELYGTTSQGGANNLGTIFKVTAMGVQTTLVEFEGTSGTSLGALPLSGLIKDASNNLYGTTSEGGADDLGTIFKVTTTGTLTTLFEFTGDTGAVLGAKPSYAPLLLATDGLLYGTTSESGDHGGGTLFRINLNANPVVPPIVTTGTATAISDTTATLGGSVDPNSTATSYYFEYGEDDNYGETTSSQGAGSGTAAVNVTANITGLTPGTTYHFRLVATNIGGTFEGLDAEFTTRTFGISEVIVKGDAAPDVSGATFLKFSPPAMNDVERFAFMGTMAVAPGGVTKANDTGIWAHNGSDDLMLIAREGSPADDTTGEFASFGNPVFANNDHVAFLAKLKSGVGGVTGATAAGIWSNTSGTLELVARQGQQVDTLDAGVLYSQFVTFALPHTGGVVFLAKVKGTGIKGSNDMGIWAADETNSLTLVAREGDLFDINGIDKTISTIQFLPTVKIVGGQTRGFNNNGDLTFRVVFTDKTQGILTYSGGLISVAITGDDANGVTDAKFKTFSQSAIDGSGNTSFLATMQIGPGDVAKASDTGIWVESGGLNLLAREGATAEDTNGVFASFSDPVARDDGSVAFYAKLKPGIGGVKASDAAGIWSNVGGSLALIARQGQQAEGAETGVLYSAFTSIALPDVGGPVFLAKLKTKKNNVGIWATDDAGVLHIVVRTGDTLTIGGEPKIVKTLEFLPTLLGVSGQTRSFNTAGDLTFRAVFTDKTEAILKVTR